MRRRFLISVLAATALGTARLTAQDADSEAPATNAAPSALSKNGLELIVRNNIFDPSRTGYRAGRRAPRVETFTYCGYALDKNPPAAFFAGSGAPRHPVGPGQTINGFKVDAVDFKSVKLKPSDGPDITLAMGMSMRKVENGPWKASEENAPEETAAAETSTNNGKATISAFDSDVIKKLKAKHNEDN